MPRTITSEQVPSKNAKQVINKDSKLRFFGDKIHRFEKGKSGNPNGRPPTAKCIPDLLRAMGDDPVNTSLLANLRKKYGPQHNPKNMREALLQSAYADAALGDHNARTFIAERTEGKVPQANVNFNSNQDTNDLTKMPLSDIISLAQELNA